MKRPRIRAALKGGISNFVKVEKKMNICKPIENGVITSWYGERISPITQKKEYHKGIDISTIGNHDNIPVLIAKAGVVTWIDKTRLYDPDTGKGSFGMVVYVQLPDKWYCIYPHMESIVTTLKIGDKVEVGQQIGIMGNTGLSVGKHLHYQEGMTMGGNGQTRQPVDIIALYE